MQPEEMDRLPSGMGSSDGDTSDDDDDDGSRSLACATQYQTLTAKEKSFRWVPSTYGTCRRLRQIP